MRKLVLIIRESEQPFDYHSTEFKELSRQVRERAKWTCQQCGIHLSDDHHFLDAHHIWGTRYNTVNDLEALCVGCHAEQPMSGHQRLKSETRYQEFMKKYGKRWGRLYSYLEQ